MRFAAVGPDHAVEDAMLRVDQRGKLGQDHLGHGHRVALALQHAGESREVGLEPVLLGVLLGRLAQVADHRVDVVLEGCDLTAGLDPDRSREVAFGHRGGDIGDGAHLRGQSRRQLVHVVGQVPPRARRARNAGLSPEPALHTDLAGHARDLLRKNGQGPGHAVDGLGQLRDLALGFQRELAAQVTSGHRRHDSGDASHLVGEVAGHRVDVVGQVLPDSADALDVGLAAKLAFGTNLTSDAGDLTGERVELVDHRGDRVGLDEELPAYVDGDLLGEVSHGHGGGDVGDVARAVGEVGRHRVDVVREVFPDAADAPDLGLAAQLALGANLVGHAGDLAGQCIELVDHHVDGVLQLQDLATDIDGDLFREIAVGDGHGDFRDVADLAGQVAGYRVDVVGEVLPRAADALDLSLAAELALSADLARDAGHLGGEGVELVDHRVDGVLELQDLALDVDGDLLGEVAVGDRRGDVGDIADLIGELARHEVDVVGEVFPRAAHALDICLAAELALGADLARDAGHLGGEGVELVDHRVDGVLELQDLALALDRDLPRKVTIGNRGGDLGDIADLSGQVAGHEVDVVGEVLPRTTDALDLSLAAELAFGAHLARDAGHLGAESAELVDHRVDDPRGLQELSLQPPALDVDRHRLREVALGHRADDSGHLGVGPDH